MSDWTDAFLIYFIQRETLKDKISICWPSQLTTKLVFVLKENNINQTGEARDHYCSINSKENTLFTTSTY